MFTSSTATTASGASDDNISISPAELQQWLERLAGYRHVEDCMSCLAALSSLPQSVHDQIWQSAETLMSRFWEVAEIEVPESLPQLLSEDLETDASTPILEHSDEALDNNAVTSNKRESATTPALQRLVTGLWVRCRDGFYGYLGTMLSDGRWWVTSPTSRSSDATSRIYAVADIMPMPTS